MQYRPNALARSLRSKCTNVIGFYSGYHFLDPRNAYFAEMVGGLQEGCAEYRKDLLLHSVYRGDSIDDIHAELVDGRIDGLVMTAPPEDPLVERLVASHLPVVVVADAVPSLPSVIVDDAMGSRFTLDHLVSRGHTRLAYRSTTRRLAYAERRRIAYLDMAMAKGIPIVEWNSSDRPTAADDFLAHWLAMPPQERPTAVSCWNDLAAYELLESCWRHRLQVPGDLAITGFDDAFNLMAFRWRLTTVRAPWAEVARTAVRLLVSQLEGKEVPQETVLPVEFVTGDST
jgi:DNA-binding LacI/PurR family transcriptional regulator